MSLPLKNPPQFSILLPVFNGEKFLKASIDSLLSQSWENFELLICDDASTDGSWGLVRSYSDPRIKAFKNAKNRGLFPNLNFLLAKANAPLIRIWSQDDVMKKDCLEIEHKFWTRHPEISISHCGVDLIDEKSNTLSVFNADSTPEIVIPSTYAQISCYWGNLSPNICNVTVSRAAFLKYGTFNERLKQAGDYEMWARICHYENLGIIKQSLVQLRTHSNQFSRWPTSGSDWAIETHAVMQGLVPFVPEEVRKHIANYIRYKNHILFFHNALFSVLNGYFRLGIKTLRFIQSHENLFTVCMRWLWTANARFHLPPLIYSIEKKAPTRPILQKANK